MWILFDFLPSLLIVTYIIMVANNDTRIVMNIFLGLFDMTMLRFESDKRVGFREYMRSDGTLSYFFSIETTRDLFLQAGFVEVCKSNHYNS